MVDVLSMKDTVGRDKASDTKFVSSFTYLIICVVSSAIKANCLVCRSDRCSVTDDITKVKGLWLVFKNNGLPNCA